MLSAEELASLADEERVSYERSKGSERDNYERILRERLAHRANVSSPQESRQEFVQPLAEDSHLGSFGIFIVFIGLLLVCFAIWMFDTAPNGTHNIGLLNQQSGMTILGGALAICGSVFFAADQIVAAVAPARGSRKSVATNSKVCQNCSARVQPTWPVCRSCGEDLR